jgi:hypothetical protein
MRLWKEMEEVMVNRSWFTVENLARHNNKTIRTHDGQCGRTPCKLYPKRLQRITMFSKALRFAKVCVKKPLSLQESNDGGLLYSLMDFSWLSRYFAPFQTLCLFFSNDTFITMIINLLSHYGVLLVLFRLPDSFETIMPSKSRILNT